MSYIIVPALPKGALIEWHVVAQESDFQRLCKFGNQCVFGANLICTYIH